MPETALFEGKYFGVRRFDREKGKRIHMHTASGLLYASHRYPSLDYVELIKAPLALTKNIDTLIRENIIDSQMASSLINDVGFTHSICKKLLKTASVLWVKDQEIKEEATLWLSA